MTDSRTRLSTLAESDWTLLSARLSASEAAVALAAARYGLVTSPDGGLPIALITAADLAGGPLDPDRDAALPAAVYVPADYTLHDLTAPGVLLLLDLPGVHGAVVLSDRGVPDGVIPSEVVDEYLGSGAHRPDEIRRGAVGDPGDGRLGGLPRLPAVRVLCAKPGCRYPNDLIEFAPGDPPVCANPDKTPHQLRLPRR